MASALTVEEEELIRHRFLTQTTVSKGEPPFKRLVKRYLQYCDDLENGSAEAAAEHYRALVKELALIEFQSHKQQFQCEAFQREQEAYIEKQAHLDEEITKAKQAIEQRQQQLLEAKLWRRQQEEYEVIKKMIMEHPRRDVTHEVTQQLQADTAAAQAASEQAMLALERQRKNFALLLHCVDELQRTMQEEGEEEGEAGGAGLMMASASEANLPRVGRETVDTPEPMQVG